MTQSVFMQPLDVLFFRGNKLFGDAGSFGEALIPPWPSVAAGALRSRMLVDASTDLGAFARGEINHAAIGSRDAPGALTIAAFHLARRDENGQVEMLIQPPADLVIHETGPAMPNSVLRLQPRRLAEGLASSAPLPLQALLAERERAKPAAGYWLNQAGWVRYLAGKCPDIQHLVHSSALWAIDSRIGIGLNAGTGSAADGQLFTTEAVAMRHGVGFLAAVDGADPPTSGSVRLGGDGRAAALHPASWHMPQPNFEAFATAGRCRLVLTSPGLFEHGWLPTGASPPEPGHGAQFDLHGVSGRITAAAVPRAEVISGWDLARQKPKPAMRAAPAGSVWWLELEDSVDADALGKLAERGLWSAADHNSTMRRAEGFNRVAIAAWT